MITCKNTSVAVCFCSVVTVLLLLWNLNQRDLYVKILESDASDEVSETLGANEEKLYDLKFRYVINSKACQRNNGTQFLAVVIVTSFTGNIERRSAMRRAFLDDDLLGFGLRRVFLLGTSSDDAYVTQNAINSEAGRFDDIIQGSFMEAYRNLTYKHVMGLRWVTKFCSNVKYVIKMDDDIVFDMHRTLELLRGIKLPAQNYVAGYIMKGMVPIREPANKWYTTLREFAPSQYPTFVSGWFYVTTVAFCSGISALSKREPYFWIDDVHVTGILAQKLGVRFLNLNRYFAVHAELMQCCLRDLGTHLCDYLIGPNGGNDEMFYAFNELAAKCYFKKCPARQKPLNISCVAERNMVLGQGNAVVRPYKLA